MSACELMVIIDDDCSVVQPGEAITGTVRVTTEKSYNAELKLELLWRTHGKGNTDSGSETEISLFSGRWLPDQTNEYRFTIEAPAGPYTYRGHLLNIDWYVRARAHISWKVDPTDETEVIVQPPESLTAMEPEPFSNQRSEPQQPKLFTYAPILLILFSIVTLGIGILTMAQSSAPFWDSLSDAGPWLFIGAILGDLGFGLAARAIGNSLAGRHLRDIHLNISSLRIQPGDTLSIDLGFEPRSRRAFSGADATLTCIEEVTKGSGTNSQTTSHEIVSMRFELMPPGELMPLQRMSGSVPVSVHEDAPLSFWENSNKIKWTLTTRIHLDGWPDWVHTTPVDVVIADREDDLDEV